MKVVDLDTARQASGLRLVLLTTFPSPWSEAARAVFDVRRVPYLAVPYRANDEALRAWTGVHNAPAAVLDDKPAVSNWSEILSLCEQMGEADSLVPRDYDDRIAFFGLAHLLLGPLGLCWQTRLLLIDVSLETAGRIGFSRDVAAYLAGRYGYSKQAAGRARPMIADILKLFTQRLESSCARGNRYLLGSHLSALDIYLAASLGILAPLPDAVSPLAPRARQILESAAAELKWQVPAVLLELRDWVYREHILPSAPGSS